MKFAIKNWHEFAGEVRAQEKGLLPFLAGGWGLIAFVLVYFAALFFHSSDWFVFAHSGFLAAVVVPPLLTWQAWKRMPSRSGNLPSTDGLSRQACLLFHTIKIWILFIVIDRLTVALFLAPYDYIEPVFWLRLVALLALQFFFFGLMSRLRWFHPRPYLFLLVIIFPAALVYPTIEGSNGLILCALSVGLFLGAYVLADPGEEPRPHG